MAISESGGELEKTALKESPKSKEKREKPFTKVIIRRLPPNMDRDTFLAQTAPVPDYDYMYMVRGDFSLGENAFSRAYINFVDPKDVYLFKEKFDNYVFLDSKGHEYPAVVEFAAFQKIPKKRRSRPDPKCGTIESDPYYLEFLESLKEQPTQEEKPEYSYQFSQEHKENVVTTPLLEFINKRRVDKQKIREERREERRRKELERKKLKDDERKKHFEEKNSSKGYKVHTPVKSPKKLPSVKEESSIPKEAKTKPEDKSLEGGGDQSPDKTKPVTTYTNRKYEDRKSASKIKPRFPTKSEFADRKPDYKSKRDDYKDFKYKKYDDYNKKETEPKQFPKKPKKYSERREERKNEAKKAEQKKLESKTEKDKTEDGQKLEAQETSVSPSNNETDDINADANKDYNNAKSFESVEQSRGSLSEENDSSLREDSRGNYEKEEPKGRRERDPRVQRRIRNKDRPTMAIYKPGMLSRRRNTDGTEEDTQ